MPYPTTEQYMEALQFPSKHLKDIELANAKVESTGMGLPFARSGGFALTFKLIGPGKSWALRLFQNLLNFLKMIGMIGTVILKWVFHFHLGV